MNNQTVIRKDEANNQLIFTRQFNASVELVWKAFTDKDILCQWWAPKPYQCIIKSMDFTKGGKLHYYMQGPEGDIHWCMAEYLTINPMKSYTLNDAFCDENLVINQNFPSTHWNCTFKQEGDSTVYEAVLTYKSLDEMEKIIAMGMNEGFTMCMAQLDELLAN